METLEKWTQRIWTVILVLLAAFFVNEYAQAKELTIPVKIVKSKTDIWVMVIDTGIASHPRLDNVVQRLTGTYDYQDPHGHGTHVAGIIVYGPNQATQHFKNKVCDNVKIFSCRFDIDDSIFFNRSIEQTMGCIKRATEMGVDYINYSAGGSGWSFSEYLTIKEFTDKGGIFVAAAGNDGKLLSDKYQYFPASYRYGMLYRGSDFKQRRAKPLTNIKVVEAMCGDEVCDFSNTSVDAEKFPGKNILSTSNKNESFDFRNGTSMAAPAYLHKLLKDRCNQLNNSPAL